MQLNIQRKLGVRVENMHLSGELASAISNKVVL